MNERPPLKIIGVARYTSSVPAFALPIVARDKDSPELFVQVLGADNRTIEAMREVEGMNASHYTPVDGPEIHAGRPYVHAFVCKDNRLVLGPIEEIKTFLRIALSDKTTPLTTKLSIAEFMNLHEDVSIYRSAINIDIANSLGVIAGKEYQDTAVRGRLWEILDSAATSPDAKARISKIRPAVFARVTDAGIVIDIDAIDPKDINVKADQIVRRLSSEFGNTSFKVDDIERVDLSKIGNLDNPTVGGLLSAIQLSKRQEERLALLIRSILVYPSVGLELLSGYSDPAGFTDRIAGLLRNLFRGSAYQMPTSQRELAVAKLIKPIFTASYPLRRGVLLHDLAMHLSDFDHISGELSRVLSNSSAKDVHAYRSRIAQLIADRSPASVNSSR